VFNLDRPPPLFFIFGSTFVNFLLTLCIRVLKIISNVGIATFFGLQWSFPIFTRVGNFAQDFLESEGDMIIEFGWESLSSTKKEKQGAFILLDKIKMPLIRDYAAADEKKNTKPYIKEKKTPNNTKNNKFLLVTN
jgi:hypothetical protein